jgi:hypothetical protein
MLTLLVERSGIMSARIAELEACLVHTEEQMGLPRGKTHE